MVIKLIKQGYEQTELGILPKDWNVDYFEEHLDVFAGVGFKKSEYTEQGIKLLRIDNVSYGKITWESIAYLPKKYLETYPKLVLEEGDVLVALNRPITNGKLKIAILQKNDVPSILYQRVGKIVFTDQNYDRKFLFYVLQKYIKKFVEETSVGTDQPFISTVKLKKLQLPIPKNPKEQTVIAEFLSDTDELMKQLDYLIEKKKNIKQGAMQELLKGKRRLEGFKEKWTTKRLGDIAEIKDGTHQTPTYVSHGIPFYSVENITDDNFTNTKYISEKEHKFLTKSFKIEKGDILMTRIGSIGDCKLIDWEVNASFYVSLALLKIRNDMSSVFLYHYSKSNFFKKEAIMRSLQWAVPKKINLGNISEIEINLPQSQEEQNAIAGVLSNMDSEIKELEKQRDKYIMIKNGMMQKLLTGEIRLK